ncbi:MAG: serine/threonine-protein kinase [Gemmatimonadetes bacterium]|nr:serine/threonine-protein kinase [Gemmatimonadota bacterium]
MPEITERLTTAIADRYRIERHLGQGGMATVYLALDVKHDRKVALKVLRPELAAVIGGERFLNEIKVTANLQHPNILALYDSGEADTFLYYVMPFVEGDTLRDKLEREKQLAVDDAIEITKSVASALDYAHRHDVIHRDIKPENILIHDGQALVADFGIALAVSQAGGNRLTETGLSLGTPHYMSPEQAMGDRELDARSDVYSLGVMLYEMLTGDPPYTGSTAQAIVAKVITEKAPPVTATRDSVPGHVAAAIQQALSKLPADRFHSAAEFADALTHPTMSPAVGFEAAAPERARREPRVFTQRQFGAVAVLGVLGVAAALWGWLRPDPTPLLSRFAVVVPEGEGLVANHDGTTLAFSPDGRRFIYTGPDRALYVRELGQLQASPLPGTEGARAPFFSPDGRWVGFFADSRLKKVALSGGPPLTIVETAASLRGAVWTEKDLIIFTPNISSPLYRVSAAGGDTAAVTMLDRAAGETSHRWPEVLPGGVGIVFTVFGATADEAHLAAVSLESGETKRFPILGMRPQYAMSGHVVYGTADGSLLAVPFDAAGLEVTGAPVSLLEGVMVRTSVTSDFTLSRSGSLAYLSGLPPELSLVMVDRHGVEEETLVEELQEPESPRVSPDGLRVALSRQESGNRDIWVYDLVQRTLTRMTFEGDNRYPFWSVDGTRIGFSSAREGGERGLYWLPADGSGTAELLYAIEGAQVWEASWMPDGQSLIVRQSDQGIRNIYAVPLAGGEEPRPLMQTEFNERSPMVSPDGGWLAYVSNESGRDEVYVRPLPGPGGKRQISTDGGTEPLWSLDGTELLYRGNDGNLYAVAIRTTPALSVGQRTVLFEDQHVRQSQHTNYDLNPRDGRFVMIKGSAEPTNLVVVLNWYEELRARMER